MSVPRGIEVQSEGACIVLSGSADSETYRRILLSARQVITIVVPPYCVREGVSDCIYVVHDKCCVSCSQVPE